MPRLKPTTIALTSALLLLGLPPSLHALGLGSADVRSRLGEPLRLVVPVRLTPSESLSSSCVQVGRGNDDGIPAPLAARAFVEQTGAGGTAIVVQTPAPVYEPIVRVVVEITCPTPVAREFTLLLDPPVASAATVAEARPTPALAAPANIVVPPGSAAAVAAAPAVRTPAPPRRPAVRAPQAPRRTVRKPAAAPAPAAPVAAAPVASAAEPAARGDRLKLVDPNSVEGTGMRVTDTLSAPAATTAAQSKFRDEQARLAALLQDKDPSAVPSTRELELSHQLQSLGAEIQALKQQMAEQAARAQSERAATAPLWLIYLFAAFAALCAIVAAIFFVRARRSQHVMIGAPWWADTLMRHDGRQAGEPAAAAVPTPTPAPASAATATRPATARATLDEDTVYPKAIVATTTATRPGRATENETADFPERVQDTTIEVRELGATQALQMLRRTHGHGDALKTLSPDEPLPSVLMPRAGARPDDAISLSSLDFDLGAPEPDADQGVDASTLPQLTEPLPVVPEHPASGAATPTFVGQLPQAMSWSDARQAQDYLRQIAESIEQADAYMAAGQAESAASVLRKLIADKEGSPRAPWLMLLQLYRKTEKRDAYETLAERFAERFGRRPPAWEAAVPGHEPGLDSDPDLLQAIWAKWGSAESMGLLSKLLYEGETPDASFFNLTLQRDLLNFVKICPLDGG